jgi:hypothetical protein
MEDSRQITAVLYRGGCQKALRALRQAGVNTAVMCHARGSSVGDQGSQVFEKEVLTVLVPAQRADEIFALIFDAAKVDRPYGGFLTMAQVARHTPYPLPDIGEEIPG